MHALSIVRLVRVVQASGVTASLFQGRNNVPWISFLFISYYLIAGIVLTNIVVAVSKMDKRERERAKTSSLYERAMTIEALPC